MKDFHSLVQDWIRAVWIERNLDAIDSMVTTDLQVHHVPVQAPGVAGYKAFLSMMLRTLDDVSVDVKSIVSHGDSGAVHWTMAGTLASTGFMPGVKEGAGIAGRRMSFQSAAFYRLQDGLIAEIWHYSTPQQNSVAAAPGEGFRSPMIPDEKRPST